MRTPSRTDLRAVDAASRGNDGHAADRGPEQLDLIPADLGRAWKQIRAEIQRIVAIRGLKQVAFDLDVQPSRLAHALAERDRKGIRAEWVPYFVEHAPDNRLASLLVAPGRWDVVQREDLTPEERLERLMRVLEKSGPAGAAVLREAGEL